MSVRTRTKKVCGAAAVVLAVSLSGLHAEAMAAGRIALVIGNGDYAHFGDLRNPANDARAMAEKLRSLRFALVGGEAHVDVTRREMARLLGDLEDAVAEAAGSDSTVLVYYSGHGMAESGNNWLVPVDDGDIRYREDVPDFAIPARAVMRRLEGRGGGLNIVILDACRNSPLPSRRKTKGALSKGLARMDAPSQTVIVYAAAPGKVAYDGEGELSPFTGALLAEMDRPGRRLVDVLGATAAAVERETSGMPDGRQEPWLEMKPLRRPFYFVPPPAGAPEDDDGGHGTGGGGGSESGGQSVQVQRMETERKFWASIEDSRNPAKFRAYLEKYGEDGEFSQLARIELEELGGAGADEGQRPAGVRAQQKPGERFRDCDESWCPELVVVPAGKFKMGAPEEEAGWSRNESPVREVEISEALAVGVYEVTRGEFGRFVRETGHSPDDQCVMRAHGKQVAWRRGRSWRNPGHHQTDRHPAVCVSWEDARKYVKWLSGKTAKGYRLLSESEWEYVARAGTWTSRYWGDDASRACRYGNVRDRALEDAFGVSRTHECSDGHAHTSTVGSYEKNGFRLHDVLGNVAEWVADCWHGSYRFGGPPRDGRAWLEEGGGDCSLRVLRGGSWYDDPKNVRSADRDSYYPSDRHDDVGFRVARTLD